MRVGGSLGVCVVRMACWIFTIMYDLNEDLIKPAGDKITFQSTSLSYVSAVADSASAASLHADRERCCCVKDFENDLNSIKRFLSYAAVQCVIPRKPVEPLRLWARMLWLLVIM